MATSTSRRVGVWGHTQLLLGDQGKVLFGASLVCVRLGSFQGFETKVSTPVPASGAGLHRPLLLPQVWHCPLTVHSQTHNPPPRTLPLLHVRSSGPTFCVLSSPRSSSQFFCPLSLPSLLLTSLPSVLPLSLGCLAFLTLLVYETLEEQEWWVWAWGAVQW